VSKRIIVAFYASSRHGSEYRAGREFIAYAAAQGFDLAVIADLDQNDKPEAVAAWSGIRVVAVPSVVRRQRQLYRISDLLPQWIWHRRVARWLRKHAPDAEVIWVQNGALPWLPLQPYLGCARTLIWGPVGGGETPPGRVLDTLSGATRWRERLRQRLEAFGLRQKAGALQRAAPHTRVAAFARTEASRAMLLRHLPALDVPVIPEILQPVPPTVLQRRPARTPRFVWVGQDIPRKNLPMALALFERLRATRFPGATLDVFGVAGAAAPGGVTFHGWVERIDWAAYRDDGVLLLTSFREGLPSAVLEAASHGLFCVCSDVGALSALDLPTVALLPALDYPAVTAETLADLAARIERHLHSSVVELPTRDFSIALTDRLRGVGALT
jgi:glycosyltransferase involved in cell wall biosynthesis